MFTLDGAPQLLTFSLRTDPEFSTERQTEMDNTYGDCFSCVVVVPHIYDVTHGYQGNTFICIVSFIVLFLSLLHKETPRGWKLACLLITAIVYDT